MVGYQFEYDEVVVLVVYFVEYVVGYYVGMWQVEQFLCWQCVCVDLVQCGDWLWQVMYVYFVVLLGGGECGGYWYVGWQIQYWFGGYFGIDQ